MNWLLIASLAINAIMARVVGRLLRRPYRVTAVMYPEEDSEMALHSGKKKKLTIAATDAAGHVIPLENPSLTAPELELVPAAEVNTFYVRQSAAYDGAFGLQVPMVFRADGRPWDGEFPVAVDFGTETLFPGDAVVVSGTVGDEEDDV